VAAAKRLQDVLGEHQDAVVAEARFVAWASENEEAADSVERLIDVERARRAQAREEWRDRWSAFEKRARKARR
jgi:CHAD domain-containing protein